MRKIMSNFITIILINLIISISCFSQNQYDKNLIFEKLNNFDEQEKSYYKYIDNKTTIEHTFSSLFFLYKTFISSQDGSVCSFHPSCSEFGVISIKKYGVIRGVLKTSDRFLRCHGLSPEKYDFIEEKNLLYDPVF